MKQNKSIIYFLTFILFSPFIAQAATYEVHACKVSFPISTKNEMVGKLMKTASHCYVKYKTDSGFWHFISGSSIKRMGFYANGGGVVLNESHRKLDDKTEDCVLVKTNVPQSKVDLIKQTYHGNEDYNLFRNNCCSAAMKALNAAGLKVPRLISDANYGVGTIGLSQYSFNQARKDNGNCPNGILIAVLAVGGGYIAYNGGYCTIL